MLGKHVGKRLGGFSGQDEVAVGSQAAGMSSVQGTVAGFVYGEDFFDLKAAGFQQIDDFAACEYVDDHAADAAIRAQFLVAPFAAAGDCGKEGSQQSAPAFAAEPVVRSIVYVQRQVAAGPQRAQDVSAQRLPCGGGSDHAEGREHADGRVEPAGGQFFRQMREIRRDQIRATRPCGQQGVEPTINIVSSSIAAPNASTSTRHSSVNGTRTTSSPKKCAALLNAGCAE